MTPPRLILALAGLSFVAFGLAFLVSPVEMAATVSLAVAQPTAVTEIRAMYGGLEIAIGVGLLTCVRRTELVPVGLRLATLAFAGLAGGRLVGWFIDGPWEPFTWLLGGVEVGVAALCGWGWRDASLRGTSPLDPRARTR